MVDQNIELIPAGRLGAAARSAGIRVHLSLLIGMRYMFVSGEETIVGTIEGFGVSEDSNFRIYGSAMATRGLPFLYFEFMNHDWLARRDRHGGCTGTLTILESPE